MNSFNLSRPAKVTLISSVYECRKPSGGTHSSQRLVIHLVEWIRSHFALFTSNHNILSTFQTPDMREKEKEKRSVGRSGAEAACRGRGAA